MQRFFEYDENPEVSDELIAMFIEGEEMYEQNKRKLAFANSRFWTHYRTTQ